MQQVRLRLESYDHKALENSTTALIEHAEHTNAVIRGPIRLPTTTQRYTVLRSPHGHKKSREQFEMRTHKRIIEILDPTDRTLNSLARFAVPSGIEITISFPSQIGSSDKNKRNSRTRTSDEPAGYISRSTTPDSDSNPTSGWRLSVLDHSGPSWTLKRSSKAVAHLLLPEPQLFSSTHDIRVEVFPASTSNSMPVAFVDSFQLERSQPRRLSIIWQPASIDPPKIFNSVVDFLSPHLPELSTGSTFLVLDGLEGTWEGELNGSQKDILELGEWRKLLTSDTLIGLSAQRGEFCLQVDFQLGATDIEPPEILLFWPANGPLFVESLTKLANDIAPANVLPSEISYFVKAICAALYKLTAKSNNLNHSVHRSIPVLAEIATAVELVIKAPLVLESVKKAGSALASVLRVRKEPTDQSTIIKLAIDSATKQLETAIKDVDKYENSPEYDRLVKDEARSRFRARVRKVLREIAPIRNSMMSNDEYNTLNSLFSEDSVVD